MKCHESERGAENEFIAYGTRALIAHSRLNRYDKSLTVWNPTIEELMYFYTKRREETSFLYSHFILLV